LIAIERARETAAIDAHIGTAIKDGDILAFARLNTEMGQIQRARSIELSRPVCIANSGQVFCDPGEFDEGSYQAQLNTGIRRMASGLATPVSGLPPNMGLSPAELMTLDAEQAPKVTGFFEAGVAAMGSIDPPEALSEDHELLPNHLRNAVTISKSMGDAAAAGDRAAFQQTLGQFVAARCETRDAIAAPEFRAIAASYFQASPPCPGDLLPPA
jgi:hypothetical protein